MRCALVGSDFKNHCSGGRGEERHTCNGHRRALAPLIRSCVRFLGPHDSTATTLPWWVGGVRTRMSQRPGAAVCAQGPGERGAGLGRAPSDRSGGRSEHPPGTRCFPKHSRPRHHRQLPSTWPPTPCASLGAPFLGPVHPRPSPASSPSSA